MTHPALYPLPSTISGVPTQAEQEALPRMFTWAQIREIIQVCDLGRLKRNPEMQARYDAWNVELKKVHGSVERYLLGLRLPPAFASTHASQSRASTSNTPTTSGGSVSPVEASLSVSSSDVTLESASSSLQDEYVRFDDLDVSDLLVGGKGMCLLPNDWPYNVPYGVKHSILWTQKPIFHQALVDFDPSEWKKINEDGFSGSTGLTDEPDWCTLGGEEMAKIVKTLWNPDEYECAWFVNPPRLQSVPGLSHAHIFARSKLEGIEA